MGLPASHPPHVTHPEARLSEDTMASPGLRQHKGKEDVEDEAKLDDCCSLCHCVYIWFI